MAIKETELTELSNGNKVNLIHKIIRAAYEFGTNIIQVAVNAYEFEDAEIPYIKERVYYLELKNSGEESFEKQCYIALSEKIPGEKC